MKPKGVTTQMKALNEYFLMVFMNSTITNHYKVLIQSFHLSGHTSVQDLEVFVV